MENSKLSTSPQLLVALGDSITFGFNLGDHNDSPSEHAFPNLIGSQANLEVRNLSFPGWTTSDLLNAMQTPQFQNQVRLAHLITLNIGSNDLIQTAQLIVQKDQSNVSAGIAQEDQQKFQETIQGASERIAAIISKIRLLNPAAKIVLFNLYNPFPEDTQNHQISEQIIQLTNTVIARLAHQAGCLLADVYTAFHRNQRTLVRLQEDDIHPSAEGQRVLAKLALDLLDQT